ncbi:MAG: FAD binding domain-containing protein [Desulfobacterales bacterium]|nr:FAD binding domain-containing protein [Desulfobacterales bacterium]
MRKFTHINATTIDEAVSALGQGKARVCAGGTDLLGTMRFEILPDDMYPEVVVNLKTITPSLDYIKEEGGMLKVGALTRLEDIAIDSTIKSKYAALAEAAHKTASPHIREMGTIGGNICQLVRCWYFRKPDNRFDCLRKNPAGLCNAQIGDNRYHSIFGGINGCFAVNPSDTVPALVALNAKVVTSKRTVAIEEFMTSDGTKTTILDDDEIVTEIRVPEPAAGTKSAFIKFALRSSIDFPIVNCAAAINGGAARICLNAVYNNPYRATAAEEAIAGKSIDEANAEAAGEAAVKDATAIPGGNNKYKVQIAKTLVKRAILACK